MWHNPRDDVVAIVLICDVTDSCSWRPRSLPARAVCLSVTARIDRFVLLRIAVGRGGCAAFLALAGAAERWGGAVSAVKRSRCVNAVSPIIAAALSKATFVDVLTSLRQKQHAP
jgi:hypothetical protein